MSIYPQVSLNYLPAEVIHHILNHLDTQTTFLSLYKVCKRLKIIIESYHRYNLDFCLISKSNFAIISRLIRCANIISLTISDSSKTPGQMQYFFRLFNLNQFTRLRSLNLLQINRHDINEILKSRIMFILHSFKVQLRENFTLQHHVLITLASIIEKSNLHKLDFNLWFCPMKKFIWPNECRLKFLKIHACSLEGYLTILHQTPRLQTFILNDFDLFDRKSCLYNPKVFKTCEHLKSLTLENCHRYMYEIEYFLSFTPSLTYLKIISDTNLLDGYRWEQYIQRNLPLLKKFEFFFVFYSQNNLDNHDIELLIKPYQTLFWLESKQWFVTCEYIKNLMEIRLYSIPICKINYTYHFDSHKIVYSTSSMIFVMNQVSKMRLNWTKMMNTVTGELNNLPKRQLFCKLTNLTLDMDHHWPFNSLQILSKFIDLSYLTELILNVTFYNNFISNAMKNITILLEQTYNVQSLAITYLLIDDDADTSMEMFCSMIPHHVKYLLIKFSKYANQKIIDDMKSILNRLDHLCSVTFQFDPFHSIEFDGIIEWLRNERDDFTHVQRGHYLHIWLGKNKYRFLEITANHHLNDKTY